MSTITKISTNNISIFPLAKNRPNDRSARLFYENNVANIIRQIVDVEGFLIEPKEKEQFKLELKVNSSADTTMFIQTVNPLVFNLYGYYFYINGGSTITTVDINTLPTDGSVFSCTLYAALRIDDITNEIIGFDDGGVYTGLSIVSDLAAVSEDGRHAMQLCTFNIQYNDESGNWVISSDLCETSYSRFSVQSLDMSIRKIDGKH